MPKKTRKETTRKSVYSPEHPNANNRGWVTESVYMASKAMGKGIPKGAIVHHVNGDIHDNASSNLVICQDHKYHRLLHKRTKRVRKPIRPGMSIDINTIHTIKEYRKYKGWTQSELAQKVGVVVSHINMIEKGVRKPSPVLAMKITQITENSVLFEDLLLGKRAS